MDAQLRNRVRTIRRSILCERMHGLWALPSGIYPTYKYVKGLGRRIYLNLNATRNVSSRRNKVPMRRKEAQILNKSILNKEKGYAPMTLTCYKSFHLFRRR